MVSYSDLKYNDPEDPELPVEGQGVLQRGHDIWPDPLEAGCNCRSAVLPGNLQELGMAIAIIRSQNCLVPSALCPQVKSEARESGG